MWELINKLEENILPIKLKNRGIVGFFLIEDVANLCGVHLSELKKIIKQWQDKGHDFKIIKNKEELPLMFRRALECSYVEKDLFMELLIHSAFTLSTDYSYSYINYICTLGLGGEYDKSIPFKIIKNNAYEVKARPKKKKRKTGQKAESIISDRIANEQNGKREVNTPSGRIDVLTENVVIEVKEGKKWKDGVGQLKAYQVHFPSHSKRLHLFGKLPKNFSDVKFVCSELNIDLTIETLS